MEQEALATKEALVKFQSFIEGETVILVTDHAALQWAQVYENMNRCLAVWGVVYAAFPGLHIIHRPSRIHSNVDPLSQLPRIPPHHLPTSDLTMPIIQDPGKAELAQAAEDRKSTAHRFEAFQCMWWEDIVEPTRKVACTMETRRSKLAKTKTDEPIPLDLEHEKTTPGKSILPFDKEAEYWGLPSPEQQESMDEDLEWNQPHLLVSADEKIVSKFMEGYKKNPSFKHQYVETIPNLEKELTPSHYQKASNGLYYFANADWQLRLCVPSSMVSYMLKWIHESSFEGAHKGPRRFVSCLHDSFYWPSLVKDAESYVLTCNVCQKIKIDHTGKNGGLRPAPIPCRPFAMISLDMITQLPPSGKEKFTAVLVIVDKLTKFTIMVLTHDTLNSEGFTDIFIARVINIFGLLEKIISDRDCRWTSTFWRAVVK